MNDLPPEVRAMIAGLRMIDEVLFQPRRATLRQTRTYTIRRTVPGVIEVTVKTDEHHAHALIHVPLHSPTGMETGYSGSGPADLAASILTDYFHCSVDDVMHTWKKSWGLDNTDAAKVIRYHQLVKEHFVAPHKLEPGESWTVTDIELCQFLIECNEHIREGSVTERLPEAT